MNGCFVAICEICEAAVARGFTPGAVSRCFFASARAAAQYAADWMAAGLGPATVAGYV